MWDILVVHTVWDILAVHRVWDKLVVHRVWDIRVHRAVSQSVEGTVDAAILTCCLSKGLHHVANIFDSSVFHDYFSNITRRY